MPAASRTRVQSWIEDGRVSVNGTPVRRVSARASCGDVLSIELPDREARQPRRALAAESIDLDILHEDEHLLVLNKPAGLVMHPTYRHAGGTLMNALLWHARDWPAGMRPSLVQRLDKLTSGVVVVAKTKGAHASLQRALTSGRGEKDYLAVVYGRVKPVRGILEYRLRRDRRDRRRVIASTSEGAPSATRFERLARAAAPRAGLSLVRCRLLTGRMHQIRVHLAAAGFPLVGDPVYGEPRWSDVIDAGLAAFLRTFPRQALHAWRIALTHPVTHRRIRFEAPIPDDLRDLLGASGLQLRP